MINIIITGNTYPIRRLLKQSGFQWNPDKKHWLNRITEAKLNGTLEAIRPPPSWSEKESPRIKASLTSVDINGNELRKEVLVIDIKPEGEKIEADYFELFNRVVHSGQIITKTASVSPSSEEIERKKKALEGFF